MSEQTPAGRAEQAVRDLADQGQAVTARAVQQAAGVKMQVALAAVQAHRADEQATAAVPPAPGEVMARFDAAWRVAVLAARAELDVEREGWTARLAAAEQAAADLGVALAESETARQQAEQATTAARAAHEQDRADAAQAAREHDEALAAQRSRADRAEGQAEMLTAERDRLLAERANLPDRLTQHEKGE